MQYLQCTVPPVPVRGQRKKKSHQPRLDMSEALGRETLSMQLPVLALRYFSISPTDPDAKPERGALGFCRARLAVRSAVMSAASGMKGDTLC